MHVLLVMVSTSSQFNCLQQRMTDISCGGGPTAIFARNVVFNPCAGVDLQFARVHGSTKTRVEFSRVDVISVIFWIVNVFFWSIDTQTIDGDLPSIPFQINLELGSSELRTYLEFLGCEAKG
jgi:hypothetical protein